VFIVNVRTSDCCHPLEFLIEYVVASYRSDFMKLIILDVIASDRCNLSKTTIKEIIALHPEGEFKGSDPFDFPPRATTYPCVLRWCLSNELALNRIASLRIPCSARLVFN